MRSKARKAKKPVGNRAPGFTRGKSAAAPGHNKPSGSTTTSSAPTGFRPGTSAPKMATPTSGGTGGLSISGSGSTGTTSSGLAPRAGNRLRPPGVGSPAGGAPRGGAAGPQTGPSWKPPKTGGGNYGKSVSTAARARNTARKAK